MKCYPQSMLRLMKELGKMPGIGQKSAERLAHYILGLSYDDAIQLAVAVRDVKKNVNYCSICCNIGETPCCNICSDPNRDHKKVCVVEQPTDLFTIEKTGFYDGVYHVLFGHINPLENVNPDDINIDKLIKRVESGNIQEVIVATNPNLEGDVTALCIFERLNPLNVKVTQLARGMSSGSYLEYASSAVIADAINGRKLMQKNRSAF
ncbi:MAG: recombination mediator RecR [Candidatus Scalinduaceae bacterium]